jgi:hypothetical protein
MVVAGVYIHAEIDELFNDIKVPASRSFVPDVPAVYVGAPFV